MGGEPNQAFWRGIRPTDPAENIPVDIKVCGITLPVGIASVIGNLPVDIKAHSANTPIIPSTPPQNIPVEVKSVTGIVPVKDSWLLQGSDDDADTNPTQGQISLDTGQLTVGYYDITVVITVTVDHDYFSLEHRNAANDSYLNRIRFMATNEAPNTFYIKNWYFAEDERFRLYQTNNMTGRLVCGMFWTKRG